MSITESKDTAGNHQPVAEQSASPNGTSSELAEFASASGHKFFARPGTTDSQIFEMVVDENEYNLPPRFQSDDIIIDIGAHIGGFSYASLDRGAGKVYAFEAHPDNHAIASKNLARFGNKISCRQQAVWRSDQPSQILYNESLTGNCNTGGVSLLWNEGGQAVATVSLDEILAEASEQFQKPIRMLKIDCEGSEYPILFTSSNLQIVKEICGEYHEMAPERIPGRARISGKFDRFDRFALKEFFESQGWTIVLKPKAKELGLFHARPTIDATPVVSEFDVDGLMSEIREAVRLREAKGEASFINASTELFKILTAEGFFTEPFLETGSLSPQGIALGELPQLRLQPEFEPSPDNRYHVNDLLKYHDRDFVWNAYRAILKREPDEVGLNDFLGLLRSGDRNKIDILDSLRSSPEGQQANVAIEGLRTPALIRKFYRLPIIGYLAETAVALARLPTMIRSQRQMENHLVAQQNRLAGHITFTNNQLQNQIRSQVTKLEKNTSEVTDSLRDDSFKLREALMKVALQQKQLATLQHQQVSAIFKAQQRLAQKADAARDATPPLDSLDSDSIEASLTEHLRGDETAVKKDLEFHLSLLKESDIRSEILDLGCGPGIWLQLLKESGFEARGVDANRRFVEIGRQRGLKITRNDVVSHLRSVETETVRAVTGFHLVEHFEFRDLLVLLAEVKRVLKPGGILILETPNPKNLVVGACNFYADPTHRKPLFPETLQFLLDSVGFVRTQVEYLHPATDSPFKDTQPGSRELNLWLFGPRDYAAMGWKS
jgi:O-antigen chain-terminating methyltransferase